MRLSTVRENQVTRGTNADYDPGEARDNLPATRSI